MNFTHNRGGITMEKLKELEKLQDEVRNSLANATTPSDVEALKVMMLGKKGGITSLLKSLGSLPTEERKEAGQKINEAKNWVQGQLEEAKERLEIKSMEATLVAEALDITLPGKKIAKPLGRLHPITTTMKQLEDLFVNLGFTIVEGPFIETIYHNFDALNTPQTHPSRDESDTFFVGDDLVLRTHTSPMQIRVMENQQPPIRVIVPGVVSRRDEIDATHTPVFHQMEGLVVDKDISFADLKGMLDIIVRYVFGQEAKVRLRPSHFPFTEPSAEVDITCYSCLGNNNKAPKHDCSVCKGSGWVELWGCGMVHPNVLRMCGIDPDIYSGYAFGLGVTRITAALYGIPTLKPYFENDMQFLNQF